MGNQITPNITIGILIHDDDVGLKLTRINLQNICMISWDKYKKGLILLIIAPFIRGKIRRELSV